MIRLIAIASIALAAGAGFGLFLSADTIGALPLFSQCACQITAPTYEDPPEPSLIDYEYDSEWDNEFDPEYEWSDDLDPDYYDYDEE